MTYGLELSTDLLMILSGLLVGLIVGSTGMGGGLVMTPLLIFGFHLPPFVAVGTDLIFAAATKIFGAWQHWRQKTIDYALLKWAALGSIPGTFLGIFLLHLIQNVYGIQLDVFTAKVLAIAFLIISAVMLFQLVKKSSAESSAVSLTPKPEMNRGIVLLCGCLVGCLVAISSVGSGTLFLALLFFFYPFSTKKLIGTDIIHGVIITGLAGIAHTSFGTVDWHVVGMLLAGSIPGVLLGSKLALRISERWIRMVLIGMLLISSVKLL